MIAIPEELRRTQALLKIEQEEDLNQYKLKSTRSPISERKENGLCWYPIVITKTEIGFGSKVVVELERTQGKDQLHLFQTGKAAQIFSNATGTQGHDGQVLTGVITSLKRNKLTLATTKEDLPDWIDEGKLGIDLTFDEMSYREMEIALRKVIEAEKSRLAQLRDIILGQEPARFREILFFQLVPELNESQNQAVKNIEQAQDVGIIHGPPGTGKTTTLVQAIMRTLQSERRLLVCAPSNTAVDLLTEKLAAQAINVIRIGNPSRVSDLLLEHTLDAQIMAHRDYKDIKLLRKNAEEYKAMAFQFKRKFGWEEREQRRLMKEESRRMLAEAENLERYIIDDLLDRVQVITCTLVGSANRVIRHLSYDTVFIDEAAQALEPACWIPITRANRVILAGDHCQLPPTIKSLEADKKGLSKTLFEKCIERQSRVAVMLKTQYRMHEHIMNFSNQQFYGGELLAHNSVAAADLEAFHAIFAGNLAVEFIDTAGCGYSEKAFSESSSVANPEEADLLLQHIQHLLKDYDVAQMPEHALKIGIISPYRAQINYLKDEIEHQPPLAELQNRRLLTVGTVDSFQGQERDIIYISMVRSNDAGEIGFLADIRRMNVAMTRARKKLVIVGDSATLTRHPFYNSFLTYTESIGAYKSAWELTHISE
ncbi:AAA domain-containing protein [Adhaeribacter pallidiroseus]|uniref:DNA helicase n=1 Tax=Adhaeribacter pallidiroseus TaxID=2072847 RepID=A0A369QJ00_9BACT|nr:AAA domain-containing protein [Adhaeribacter pallidiroseus]RDC63206.1 DNA helicase [Adhaeribacter pallidiroseus]